MSIFSDIKKYRRPLTDINEKIQYLNERMTSSGFYWEVDDPGQPWEIGDTPDDKMGDLADTDNFTVADQTGSSPDMSQLTTTDALGNTVNRLSTPEGSGGLGIIRYANMGTLGGTYYSVLRSDNRTGDSYLTSVSGGDPAVRAWVEANYNKWTTVQWHYYANPGMADNVFNPIARNVGPGGAYTLWGASLLVVKNPNFINQQGISATYNKYGLDSTRYFYFRSRGSSGGGRTITSRLYGFGNAMRGVGGFVGGFAGKNFNKFLRNAARAGIPVGDINQATAIFYGHPPAPPKPAPAPAPVTSIPDKGLEKMPTIGPDIPDKGLEKMPTIEPDKPETPPVPPVPPAPPTPPKPTPPPAPTPPAPPSTPPQPSYNPSPEDLAKIGAPAPPPPPGYGDRGKFFDDYLTKPAPQSKNDYVNQAFANTNYTLQAHGALSRSLESPEALAASLDKAEEILQSYKNMIPPSGDSFAARMARAHLETERLNKQADVDKLKASITKAAVAANQRTLNAKNDFEQGGDLEKYINAYKDSHTQEVTKVAEQELERLKTGESVPETSPISKAIASAIDAIPKNVELPFLSSARVLAQYAKNIQNTGKGGTIANPMTSGEVDDIINNIDLNMIGDYSTPEQMIKSAIKQLSAGHTIFGSGGYDVQIDDSGITISDPSYKFDTGGANPIPGQAWGDYLAGWLSPITLPVGLALFGANPPKASATVTQKIPMSQIKEKNPKLYQKLQEYPDFGRIQESLNESIEFEQQTGVPVDHVANVMNGIADAVEVLNDCIISLHKSSRTWKRPQNKKRYEIETDIEGSETKPLEITLSENTNQYLLTNAFTGEPYHPEKDGRLSEFIVGNASRPIDQGGNVAAKCVIDNLIRTPEVIIDNEENIVMMGQIYLFNSKQGVEYSIMTQAMSALSGITDRLGFSIEGFKGNWNQQYESEIRAAFAGIEDLDKEVPILNVVLKIPFDQAHLYTMNSYLHSPENVKESMLAKWKKRTSPEDRHNQGEYEFFLNALSSLPSVAQTYIKIELAMQLENLLKAPNQQMDPKMIKVMSMVNANDVYVDNTFVENEKLFDKLKKSIKKNIQLTDPNTFKATPTPIKHDDVVESKQRSIKKYLPGNKKKSRQTFLTKK